MQCDEFRYSAEMPVAGVKLLASIRSLVGAGAAIVLAVALSACAQYPEAPSEAPSLEDTPQYVIGPGDQLEIFVWRNPELTRSIPVRPDGRISVPLIEDVQAAGKTPTELARELEDDLGTYVQNPLVTIIVTNFRGTFDKQVRIVGEAAQPQAIAYRRGLTVLDAMIEVGGLTEFAAGNRAVIVRRQDGEKEIYRARLDDLLKDGDISANVDLLPGDVVIVPESWF